MIGTRLPSATGRGPRLRDLAARTDILLSGGVRLAAQQFHQGRRANAAEVAAGDRVYDAIWCDAAARTGAELERLGGAFIRIHRGNARTLVWRQWVQLDDAVTVKAALDRGLVHGALARSNIPVPENLTIHVGEVNASLARRFLHHHGAIVVKPASGTGGGRGATADVRTVSEMRRAALLASRHGEAVILERSIPGQVYRLLFLDGQLVDVVRRKPPRIVGDGRSTIRALVHAENRRRLAARGDLGLPLITANLDMLLTLAHQSLTPSSVPLPGEHVMVKTVTNQSGPRDNETVRESVSPTLVQQAASAAAALGVRLAGVDIITPDLGSDLAAAGGGVIEVNAGPGLHHHYHVRDRESATAVCVPILQVLLDDGGATRPGHPVRVSSPARRERPDSLQTGRSKT